MNWDAISAVSETIASIAVVVTLIYLAIQIKQANKLSQGQTRVELRHMAQAEVYKVIDYPEIIEAFSKKDLTDEEAIRLHNYLISALRFREFIWRQFQLGLLDQATFSNYSKVLIQVLGSKRCRSWWNDFKNLSFDPAFIQFVDDLLENNPTVEYQDLIMKIKDY
jgi:hypothetical protein